jgi:serine/threonine-protein kinase
MDGRAEQPIPEQAPISADSALTLGDYVLGPRLARRVSADVYDATHTPTGAPRLVYVLRPAAMRDHPLVHRVVCEVDAARWLRHPAVAKVDGYGDTPSRRLYVGVERAPGRTLGELLADGERLVPSRVVRLAARLVEALDEAHAVGLTHGRLTPEAVVVADESDATGSPLVTLVGLGVGAVAFDAEVSEAERPYVSPEQLGGGEADARSDVFGLASLLQHALLGAAPTVVSAAARADDGAGDDEHRSTAAVLAAARSADPRRRPATVKGFWVELLAALVADASAVVGARIERTRTEDEAADLPPAARAPEVGLLQHLELDVLDFDAAPAEPTVRRSAAEPSFGVPSRWSEPAPVAPPAALAPRPAVVERAVSRPAAHDLIDHDWERDRERERTGRPHGPGTAAAAAAAQAEPAARGRRRRRVVALLCLAVPAVAAALSLPLAYEDDGDAPRIQESAAEVTTPYELPIAAREPLPEPAVRDSTERALPSVPLVDLPDAGLPTVDPSLRPLVRPGDFAGGISRPDSLR